MIASGSHDLLKMFRFREPLSSFRSNSAKRKFPSINSDRGLVYILLDKMVKLNNKERLYNAKLNNRLISDLVLVYCVRS